MSPAILLVETPTVKISPLDPLAAEMLEHWAAKLVVRDHPGDAQEAQRIQEAAEKFRQWHRDNPGAKRA